MSIWRRVDFWGDFLYFECSKLTPLDGTFETLGISVKSQVCSASHHAYPLLGWKSTGKMISQEPKNRDRQTMAWKNVPAWEGTVCELREGLTES